MFSDGLGDGGVQTAIQGVKVLGADERAALDRQLGDRLTDVTVVVDHLRHGETHSQQLLAMLRRSRPDRVGWERKARVLAPERFCELAQEEGNPVFDLLDRSRFERACSDLSARARDQLVAVQLDEFVEHETRSQQESWKTWKTWKLYHDWQNGAWQTVGCSGSFPCCSRDPSLSSPDGRSSSHPALAAPDDGPMGW